MFAGRTHEIQQLLGSFNDKKGTLNVIRGRRRIGKTRLIKELPNFNQKISLRYLTSSPPSAKISDKQERADYAEQVKEQFDLAYLPPHSSWKELFIFISDICNEKNTVLAIDEVNWLATKSRTFMSIFFQVWENHYSRKANFMMILSGSLSSWIEENILMNKGFVGRVTISLTLRELELHEVKAFFGERVQRTPTFEIIKMLSAVGAVPRYLEELDLKKTAEVNLQNIAFNSSGILHDEFEKMFYDLFSKENTFYRRILETLGHSKILLSPKALAETMKLTYSGRFTNAIKTLEEVGFIKRQYAWNPSTCTVRKIYALRLSDNYTAFYFRAIVKTKSKGLIQSSAPKYLPSLLGLQFENLCHNNVNYIIKTLHIKKSDVLFAGPYIQTASARRKACQIDLLIHAKNRVYICECKLRSDEIGKTVIPEVQEKIEKLTQPKGVSFHPVLIHANSVSDNVIEVDYFDAIIDLGQGLF